MIYPHRIRLRGPWECEPIDGPPPRRVFMPSGWLEAGLAGFHGQAHFIRSFGYPGNVDETEHVWLTCDRVVGCREVRLNGHLLSQESASAFSFDVTSILTLRNRLEVLLDGASDDTGLWGEVVMEIRKDAYLADMLVTRTESAVIVTGKAVGVAPQPLELYVLVDGSHADYRTIAPSLGGTPIRIELPEVAPTCQYVRVDLINISSIWYAIELPIPESHAKP